MNKQVFPPCKIEVMYFLCLGIISYYIKLGAVTLFTLRKKSFHFSYDLLQT